MVQSWVNQTISILPYITTFQQSQSENYRYIQKLIFGINFQITYQSFYFIKVTRIPQSYILSQFFNPEEMLLSTTTASAKSMAGCRYQNMYTAKYLKKIITYVSIIYQKKNLCDTVVLHMKYTSMYTYALSLSLFTTLIYLLGIFEMRIIKIFYIVCHVLCICLHFFRMHNYYLCCSFIASRYYYYVFSLQNN